MAGYLMGLNSLDSLRMYTRHGVYATKIPPPRGRWMGPQEGTFADYSTMKPGDNIYFFIKRGIFGIGELTAVGNDCKYQNFPQSGEPQLFEYDTIGAELLWDEGEMSVDQRWMCTFKPSPCFFSQPVDMDDVLASRPSAFKMLRAFWKLSFIKFDDDENQAFKDILLKSNYNSLEHLQDERFVFSSEYVEQHRNIAGKLPAADYRLAVEPLLSSASNGDRITHEMALEAGVLHQLASGDPQTLDIFGTWDYLSHQVVASPFKPVDYMDKIDVSGVSARASA